MSLKKHLINIRIFKAYRYLDLFKEAILFPYDYFFRKGKSFLPLNIALFLTLRCNAKCKMCNLQDILNKDNREPKLEEIENFVKTVRKRKPSFVLFGGEPLLRNDFVDIVKIIKKYKLSCGIFTNGLLLDEERIKEIVENKLDYVVFSLQGIGKVHDEVVSVEGAYEKLIKNLELFCKLKKKTKVIIHTTITEDNVDNLQEIVELGRKLDVDLIRFGHPTFFTESDIKRHEHFCKVAFPGEDVAEMSWSYDPSKMTEIYFDEIKKLKKNKDVVFTPDLSEEEVNEWYGVWRNRRKCKFVWRGLFIFPNGDVYPCESINYKMGNIFEKDFKKIWNSERYVNFRNKLRKGLFPACARCCKL
ncbi:hypothetical protein CL618_00045 [archaeon]|nr:hypothetical protein [archaeon]|tara:strand:- start:692 stop:1768 length:1077 start_codon:yes stop_codon:yes gene_type:complete